MEVKNLTEKYIYVFTLDISHDDGFHTRETFIYNTNVSAKEFEEAYTKTWEILGEDWILKYYSEGSIFIPVQKLKDAIAKGLDFDLKQVQNYSYREEDGIDYLELYYAYGLVLELFEALVKLGNPNITLKRLELENLSFYHEGYSLLC